MNPQSKSFLVITIILLVMAVFALVQGMTPAAIILGVFGLLGLFVRNKGKK